MRMYDIIKKKRDGGELSREEIEFFVRGFTCGEIPDYQASALCMAIFYEGMTSRETADLTLAMAKSGDCVDLSELGELTVDKHSTGGVGDKTTLIVAPIVASLGCTIAKMSGRGLGHTGGTVDKLEAIGGFNTALSPDDFIKTAKEQGICVVGQTGNLTPADKKLYALRDVTATVDSLPLIASSIMSKKLAAGAKTIVLDVKYGSGAFMKTPESAAALAREMVAIGKANGRRVSALITDMERPLGQNIGNALEVKEAIEVLKGKGPEDLRTVCVAIATQIVALSKNIEKNGANALVENSLTSGKAYEKFISWIGAQGGNTEHIRNPELLPSAKFITEIKAEKTGYITAMDAEKVGVCSVILGAGREVKDAPVNMGAGIILYKKTGDSVKKNDLLALFYTDAESKINSALTLFGESVKIGEEKPEELPLVYDIIE